MANKGIEKEKGKENFRKLKKISTQGVKCRHVE
jgi:hypothetical protein